MFEAPLLFGMYQGPMASKVPGWDVYFQNGAPNAKPLYEELLWACSRRETCASDGCRFKTLEQFSNALVNDYAAVQAEFYRCLTPSEQDKLTTYQGMNGGVCYSLNQDPDFGATMSTWQTLHTVIHNAGIIWKLG